MNAKRATDPAVIADIRFAISCYEWILKRQPDDQRTKKALAASVARLKEAGVPIEPELQRRHD